MKKLFIILAVAIPSFTSLAMDGHDANIYTTSIQNSQGSIKKLAQNAAHYNHENIMVTDAAPASVGSADQSAEQISGIRIVGQPVLVFDHSKDRIEPNHFPDATTGAWKEADGTVNIMISHYENYRMRGPDLEHLRSDPKKIYSSTTSASDIVESNYNYHHWISSPYSLDGQTIYALVHSEWYACLLNKDCSVRSDRNTTSTGNSQGNSWVTTLTSFKSMDGGSTWEPNGKGISHVIANEGFFWTKSFALLSKVYRKATNHSGLMNPSRIVKEGNYYYFIGSLVHRDFSRLDLTTDQAPIDKYGYVLMRTTDIGQPSGWEAWVRGPLYQPIAGGEYNAFLPQMHGQKLNASTAQLIYDTKAKVYVVVFSLWGKSGAIYYMTTPSLANPIWSDAMEISGTSTFPVDPRSLDLNTDCNKGFQSSNYVSLIDSHSAGLNFEFTDGDPWLFYIANPARCGGNNLNRDVYRLKTIIDYKQIKPTPS